jgi:hypothetical protein
MKKSIIASAVITSMMNLSSPVQAAVLDFGWSGLLTVLNTSNRPVWNTSYPYYGDPTWGYGVRTQISGTMSLDTVTGTGVATVTPFDFFSGGQLVIHDMRMQIIGDGFGGQGSLILSNMLFDWNANDNISLDVVLDAAGLFTALPTMLPGSMIDQTTCAVMGSGCTIAATDSMRVGMSSYYPMGAIPVATTTYNVNNAGTAIGGGTYPDSPNGVIYDANDTIGGSPIDNGPFLGFGANFDMLSVTLIDINPVPIPASIWLFVSGILGLAGVAGRRKFRHLN